MVSLSDPDLVYEVTGTKYISTGAVSGPKGCTVKISDAVKKPWPEILPQSTEGDSPAASATV